MFIFSPFRLSGLKLQQLVAIALTFAVAPFAGATVPEFPEPGSSGEPAIVIAQAELNAELLEAMRNLQTALEGEESATLAQASDRLQSLLQDLLKGQPLEVTPELSQASENLQNAIAAKLEREDTNLTPEVRQKLGLVRRLLGTLLSNNEFSLSQEIIEGSPVLQRWREGIPDVLEDIRNDPAFRTRVRLGYSQFPSTDDKGGFNVGVEDIFLGRTGLTLSANYDRVFDGDRSTAGVDLNYYLLPLGSYINVAPVVGYRNITTGTYWTDGIAVGGKIILPLSRTGAADLTFSQLFVSPGSSDEVGITTLSAGYALTRHLRISTDIQKQNSIGEKDSRVGIVLEWMP